MSNRRHPRKPIRTPLPKRYPTAADIECPDCDSEVELTEVAPGVFSGLVRHDPTCPWLAAREASR